MTWLVVSLILGTSIEPLRLMLAELGGSRVEAFALIPPGASPHTYDPRPRDFARLAQADAVILVGKPLDHWVHHPRRVVLKDVLGLPDSANPHIWLSFAFSRRIAAILTDSLATWDPEGAETYRQRLKAFLQRTDSLEARAKEMAKGLGPVVLEHPAWTYLFREMGTPVAGVVMPHEGAEPSPKALAFLIRTVRKAKARLLILEPAGRHPLLETLLSETRLDTVTLDPLGGLFQPASFTELLEKNLERLAQAVVHDTPR